MHACGVGVTLVWLVRNHCRFSNNSRCLSSHGRSFDNPGCPPRSRINVAQGGPAGVVEWWSRPKPAPPHEAVEFLIFSPIGALYHHRALGVCSLAPALPYSRHRLNRALSSRLVWMLMARLAICCCVLRTPCGRLTERGEGLGLWSNATA